MSATATSSSLAVQTPECTGEGALGLFGGTFDPIHFGHLRLAEEAVIALGLAEIRWIPAGQPLLRGQPLVSPGQRLAMVRLGTANNPRFSTDAGEIETAEPSYTVRTLERLRGAETSGRRRPLVLLVGADAFLRLPAWHRWPSLFDLAHLAVAHRPGFVVAADTLPRELGDQFRKRQCSDPAALVAAPAGRVITFAMTPLAISATQVRQLLSAGQSARYLLPDTVLAYIRQQGLYLDH